MDFKGYSAKAKAIRALRNKGIEHIDDYLVEVDGKWGFRIAGDGEPVKVKVDQPKPRRRRIEKNGVYAPIKGVCREVWDYLDGYMLATGAAPKPNELAEVIEGKNWNPTNVRCELYAWRKFHGISKR